MRIEDARAKLTAPGMPFETEWLNIRGLQTRVYKNAVSDLRTLFLQGRRWSGREFIVFGDERLSYDAHYRAVARLAQVLVERYGVKKGDRVAIAMRNYPEWSVAFWALAVIGAVTTALNAWGTGEDLLYAISDAGCKAAIVDAERLHRLRPLRAQMADVAFIAVRTGADAPGDATTLESLIGGLYCDVEQDNPSLPDVLIEPDDYATIFYTSGTTGRPKGALGTHRNITSNIVNIDFSIAMMALRAGQPLPDIVPEGPQKTLLLPVPFFHVTGTHSAHVPALAKGRKLVLMYKWNAENALELIEQERITNTIGVPSMAWQLLESPRFASTDLSSMEGMSYGGAAAAPELTRRATASFDRVLPRQGYGATETSAAACANCGADFQRKPDSVGLPAPICDIRIADANGAEVPVDQVGEIWVRGANVVEGYWHNGDATAEAFVDGWYRTGDIGRVDEEGFVYVLDRIKDMLIRGGENVYCAEVEAALFKHDAVLDAAVFGVPDRVLGEQVAAVIQLKPGSEVVAADLQAHAARHLASFKVPKFIAICSQELPRNANGKVLKRYLRDTYSVHWQTQA